MLKSSSEDKSATQVASNPFAEDESVIQVASKSSTEAKIISNISFQLRENLIYHINDKNI